MPHTPKPQADIAQKYNDLLRRVKALEAGNSLQAGTFISGGGFTATDPNTSNRTVFLGLGPMQDGSGRKQMESLLYRADGTIALSVYDGGTINGHTFEQSISLWDRNNRIIVSDDTVSGHGLSTPHLATTGTLVNTNTSTWPATTAATFTTIANAEVEIQNPKLRWTITLLADSGVTAQFQMLINGTQIGTTQTVTSAFSTWTATNVSLGALLPGNTYLVELQAKVTAGAASARAQCLQLTGDQS